jgi:adenylylsulfate kinase
MSNADSVNLRWHPNAVSRADREGLMGHRGFTLWFTGLSAAGKSTLAVATEKHLFSQGCHTYVLDGDNIRHGLNRNLGFSAEDRSENIRRIAEVARLFSDCGIINLTAFISPYREDRRSARDLSADGAFFEVFVDCPLEVCERRDPKGMYKRARDGVIKEFTGISAPYEPPENPEIHLRTDELSVTQCVRVILDHLTDRGCICAC